jgi:hypothetical protein
LAIVGRLARSRASARRGRARCSHARSDAVGMDRASFEVVRWSQDGEKIRAIKRTIRFPSSHDARERIWVISARRCRGHLPDHLRLPTARPMNDADLNDLVAYSHVASGRAFSEVALTSERGRGHHATRRTSLVLTALPSRRERSRRGPAGDLPGHHGRAEGPRSG